MTRTDPLAVIERARTLATATIHEAAGQQGALPSEIKPIGSAMRVCGTAVTVRCDPGDNLWIHRALYANHPPHPVLVVDVGHGYEAGYWGEILTVAAMHQRIEGLVIDGGVRDAARLLELGLPVFARGICIRGTTKQPVNGGLDLPITVGDVRVDPGDLVVGDADGVVIVPSARAEMVVDLAAAREVKEHAILERIRTGERTLDIYGLPE